jgi:hypothetical protein
MTAQAQLSQVRPPLDRARALLRSPSTRYLGGVLLLAAAERRVAAPRQPDRPTGRQHGGDHRRCRAVASIRRTPGRAGPSGTGRWDAGCARDRDRDQRDGGHDVDAARRRHRRPRPTQVLAELVAPRHFRRARRPAARNGLVSGSRGCLAAHPHVRGFAAHRLGGRAERTGAHDRRTGDVRRLSRAHPGGVPIRTAGRDAGPRRRGGAVPRASAARGASDLAGAQPGSRLDGYRSRAQPEGVGAYTTAKVVAAPLVTARGRCIFRGAMSAARCRSSPECLA